MLKKTLKHLNRESIQNIAIKTKNFVKGPLKKKIFYLHIPKCGGTSLNKALQSCYVTWSLWNSNSVMGLNSTASWEAVENLHNLKLSPTTVDDSLVLSFRENLLLYSMAQKDVHYVTGHFPFSAIAFDQYSQDYDFITVLRDPVERWISSYFYNRFRQKQDYRKLDLEFDEYLMSDYGKSQGYEYSKFLSGLHRSNNFMSRQSIDAAKENIHKFKLIGFLDQMDIFLEKFEENYFSKLSMSTLNARPSSEIHEIDHKKMEKINEICSADLEIFNYAKSIHSSSTK